MILCRYKEATNAISGYHLGFAIGGLIEDGHLDIGGSDIVVKF